MRILIAPDKFKGSLTAAEAAAAMARGFGAVFPRAVIERVPLADGGEGWLEAFRGTVGGELRRVEVGDALGRRVGAVYLLAEIEGVSVAVIESSQACGLWRIAAAERCLPESSTHGVGELMRAAAAAGAGRILIGLGGSATNDAGLGMAQALGFRIEDRAGAAVRALPSVFERIARIVPPEHPPSPAVVAACDVRNPLLGERGATRVYGPQKGLREEDRERFERGHARVADLAKAAMGVDFRDAEGAGAAGGLGFGLLTFCGAALRPGFDCVAEVLGLGEKVRRADLVVTGEGGMDAQTLEGKAPAGLAALARRHGVPVVAIAGTLADDERLAAHFDALAGLVPGPMSIEHACERADELLAAASARLARALAVKLG